MYPVPEATLPGYVCLILGSLVLTHSLTWQFPMHNVTYQQVLRTVQIQMLRVTNSSSCL